MEILLFQELYQLPSERDVIREIPAEIAIGSLWSIGETNRESLPLTVYFPDPDWLVVKTVFYRRPVSARAFGDVCLAFIAPRGLKVPPISEWDVTRLVEDYPLVDRYVNFSIGPEKEVLTHGWRLDGSIKLGPIMTYLPDENGRYIETPTDWDAVKGHPYEKPESELT